jgi:hypothetical protein
MRAFTITEAKSGDFVEKGVVITGGDHPGLWVGEFEGESSTHIPLCNEGAELFRAADAQTNQRLSLVLPAAEVSSTEPTRIIKEREHSPCALIHMAMCAGEGGELWLEAAGFDEREDDGGVYRVPRPFPSLGVEVVAFGHGPGGEPQGLFKMTPGSAFRIMRTGDVGQNRVFNVAWTGHKLYVRPKYRR